MRIRNPLPKKNRELVLNRDGRRCAYCGKGDRLEVDHVIPIKHNGTDLMSNLITSCKKCNGSKSRHRLLPVFERQVLEWVRVANETSGIDENMDASRGNGEYREYKKLTKEEKDLYDSDRPSARQKKRTSAIENRLLSAGSLYYLEAKDDADLLRIRKLCNYYKYKFMSVPTGISDERIVFIDGRIKNANQISPAEAVVIAFEYSKGKTRCKVSGSLGK